jgi:hypothetical protein
MIKIKPIFLEYWLGYNILKATDNVAKTDGIVIEYCMNGIYNMAAVCAGVSRTQGRFPECCSQLGT